MKNKRGENNFIGCMKTNEKINIDGVVYRVRTRVTTSRREYTCIFIGFTAEKSSLFVLHKHLYFPIVSRIRFSLLCGLMLFINNTDV
jgi:hypothetical protein